LEHVFRQGLALRNRIGLLQLDQPLVCVLQDFLGSADLLLVFFVQAIKAFDVGMPENIGRGMSRRVATRRNPVAPSPQRRAARTQGDPRRLCFAASPDNILVRPAPTAI